MRHQITRVRHELRRRALRVRRVESVTPGMLRVVLGGDDLDGFTSLGADDHIKLFVPGDAGEAERRDYTPRRYDFAAGELAIDFALHDAGPATDWDRNAQPGDQVEVGGPRGSMIVPPDFDWLLLLGDETALPAIGRRVEELPKGTPVTSLVTVTSPDEEQVFSTVAEHRAIWLHRPLDRADDAAMLLDALAAVTLPPGDASSGSRRKPPLHARYADILSRPWDIRRNG